MNQIEYNKFKNRRTVAIIALTGILLFAIYCLVGCKSHKSQCDAYSSNNTTTVIVPEQIDLSVLDSLDYIYDWHVQDGVLRVTTVRNVLDDELERLEYIKKNFYE